MKTETIKKYDGKSLPTLLKTAQKWFNLFIRLRDTDEYGYGRCISSGQTLKIPSENAHAGHLFSAGKFARLRFDERNVNLQSKSDNYFNGGNETMYRVFLTNKIGEEEIKDMERIALDRTPFKWDRFAVIDIIETYKTKANELKKTKMFKI